MKWNWQLPEWPRFSYRSEAIAPLERKFLLNLGSDSAYLKTIGDPEKTQFIVEILSIEGLKSSKIEGELLERESLQSSIRKQFGLDTRVKSTSFKERGMAELLATVYKTFKDPLTHEMLGEWHAMLFTGQTHLETYGHYRTHEDPMQIVSGRLDSSKVFYEAPPSKNVPSEMARFIDWYNNVNNDANLDQSILGEAALAHLYFESIHPFEDGNGRLGRVLVEKFLSRAAGQPTLIALSRLLEQERKRYYAELQKCNHTLEVSSWVTFFAEMILKAQEASQKLLFFLMAKSKMFASLKEKLNSRQEKVLLRLFEEGPEGFVGGLSAEKYIAITKASRATATRDLAELVEWGALTKTGQLRHTRYSLNI